MNYPLSIVLPVHNEKQAIERVVTSLCNGISTKLPSEIVICEDGSTDGVKEVLQKLAKRLPLRVYLEDNRKGYAKAVADGLKRANNPVVFFCDSDGQYDPNDFWSLFAELGKNDMVIGRKFRRNDPLHRTILGVGFNYLTNALFGMRLQDKDCGFRLVRKKVIDEVLDEVGTLKHSFWAEFTIRAFKKGFKIREVPITHYKRLEGITQIYKPKKIPSIVYDQMRGLLLLKLNLVDNQIVNDRNALQHRMVAEVST
jgi:glycosyltransferase involved in cell wall biosynthesis